MPTTPFEIFAPPSELAELPVRFRVLRALGSGGFGVVYLALDDVLKREVALKVLTRATNREEVQQAILSEARALAAVAHPNIASVLDVLTLPTVDVLVLEYVAGQSLGDVLQSDQPVPRARILHLLAGTAAGLEAIHKAGLLHCDLKPENVLVDSSGRARIVDFGLARLDVDLVTQSSGGSPGYAAPEIMMGEPATVASDLYAFGIVAWELFAGRRAYGASKTLETLAHKIRENIAPLSEVAGDMPADVRYVVAQCLKAEPAERPQSASSLIEIFRPYLAGTLHETVRDLRGTMILFVLPVLAMLTMLGAVVWFWITPLLPGFTEILSAIQWSFSKSVRLTGKLGIKSLEAIVAVTAGMFLVVALILKSAYNIARQSMRSGRGALRFRDVFRASCAPPRCWPTWYPGHGTPAVVRSMPKTIDDFRLFTWWVIPIASFVSVLLVIPALSSDPAVSPVLARWVVAGWLATVCTSGAWLAIILHRYRNTTVYDTFELAAVALFRAPVDDIARAFPEPMVFPPGWPERKFSAESDDPRIIPQEILRPRTQGLWGWFRSLPELRQVLIVAGAVPVSAILFNLTRELLTKETLISARHWVTAFVLKLLD